jgi:hypothetical protein
MSMLIDRRTALHHPTKPKRTYPPKKKETKKEREQRLARFRAERQALRENLLCNDDDAVLTFAEWCALNGFSQRQGRRIVELGQGPVITQLSERKIGVSRKNNRLWQETKARAVPQLQQEPLKFSKTSNPTEEPDFLRSANNLDRTPS